MLRNRFNGAAILSACLLFGSLQAEADWKSDAKEELLGHRVYDATTHISTSRGMDITTRSVCDGKGHKRIESKTAAGGSVIIMDIPNKKTASIIESSKVVMWSPLPAGSTGEPGNLKEKTRVKALGNKTVNGHPCKGESYSVGDNNYEVWTGTDIDYPVKSVVVMDSGTTTTELKSFSSKAPDASLFEVPSTGYKVLGAK